MGRRCLHRFLHIRIVGGPGLVAIAHVAGGAEGEVDVLAAGANPVVLTPPTVGAGTLSSRLATVVDLRRHGGGGGCY